MSGFQPTMVSNSSSDFNEDRWVIQIRRTLDEELEEDTDIPVRIFNVPRTLMVGYPDCYVPQEVALGPYHYRRPELFEMQRYKLAAAKRIQKQLQNIKFHDLVDQLTKLEARIRAWYHKYLDFNGETLVWMMAIDAAFLLEFLQIYTVKEGKVLTRVSSRMSHLLDVAGRKSAHNAILRDMVMLENQIPLFLLRKMLELQFSSLDLADQMLCSMVMGFWKELSPFKMIKEFPHVRVTEGAHLLDFLYHVIVPISEEQADIDEANDPNEAKEKSEEQTVIDEANDPNEAKETTERSFGKLDYVRKLVDEIWKLLSKLTAGPVSFINSLLFSSPVKVVSKLPWTIISQLPGFKLLKQPIENLFLSQDKEENQPEDESSDSNNSINKPPLMEEISIPSVTELSKAGVRFLPSTNDSILTIRFDIAKATFYLPTVSLDANTEVVLRNLVAYEACNASGPLVFARYTELMNGIIDSEEDVKLLRKRGIILNRLKSDKEVADLWNGMCRTVRLTQVSSLDKVIEDVNKYYNGRWKVKVRNFMKLYVFRSWKCLVFLTTVLLLLLMTLQAFCSVYSCARIFHF